MYPVESINATRRANQCIKAGFYACPYIPYPLGEKIELSSERVFNLAPNGQAAYQPFASI
ncbi:MAG: hypothetical protein DWB42_21215 [Chloroflexi bacterium]|nr:hypothetical protein [Chloroflexota bacterium]